MRKSEKNFSLRIEEKLMRRFDYVAKYDDCSMNWMLNSLIRRCIAEFEAERGEIVLTKDENDGSIWLKHEKSFLSEPLGFSVFYTVAISLSICRTSHRFFLTLPL